MRRAGLLLLLSVAVVSCRERPAASVLLISIDTLRSDRLPGIVTQFHPRDLQIVRNERWSSVSAGVAHADVSGTVPGAPVSLVGTAVLAPTDAGSRLKLTATVDVDIPLVGGKLEDFIGRMLAECAFCGTALPLQEAYCRGNSPSVVGWSSRTSYQELRAA